MTLNDTINFDISLYSEGCIWAVNVQLVRFQGMRSPDICGSLHVVKSFISLSRSSLFQTLKSVRLPCGDGYRLFNKSVPDLWFPLLKKISNYLKESLTLLRSVKHWGNFELDVFWLHQELKVTQCLSVLQSALS